MAVTVKRSDLFPVGTSVGAYPATSRHFAIRAAGVAVETHVVDAAGSLGPFTTLTADQPYVLWAEVAGKDRYLGISDSIFTALGTLAERIAAVRVAVGA